MATQRVVNSVAALWRFPVKSMRGERLEQVELTERGLVGDRAYALVDAETGKVVSAKSVKLFPDLLGCRAAFVAPPRVGEDLPPVRVELPDGTTVDSDAGDADRVLSAFFRRKVTLTQAAPEDFTIDQYHPDVEDADPSATATRSSNRSSARPSSLRPVCRPPSLSGRSSTCSRFPS